MKKLLIGGMLLALLLPCHAMAQSAFDGTWKIDINKVQASNKPEVITLKDGEYSCNCTPPIHVKADGMDHAVTGHPTMDTVSVKIVDDHTITETGKKNGKVVYTDTTKVADDGKTATFESTNERDDNSATVKGTLTRVGKAAAGSHAVAGSWHASSFQSASDNMLSYTYKVAGNDVSMSNPRGESYKARLDGKPVPYTGDPGTDKIAVKMVGKSMQETTSLAGKVTSVATMTVSADGKSMTTVITNKPSNRKITLVAMKQ
ncbi:hypothetical protein ACPPVV_12005 [Rhodanobacter sp. Col0626]|uniref:hypothetical protein n=1 Tax=Rhodanobacter sp. Col0626 TaxID=3415679 RepID=UPI003CE923C3